MVLLPVIHPVSYTRHTGWLTTTVFGDITKARAMYHDMDPTNQ